MGTCTFFGHRDCPDSIGPTLRKILVELITEQGVDVFYVGHQGRFDAIVRSTLRQLQAEYSQIRYAVVLAYMPPKNANPQDYADTMVPEGIETIHPRYAISWRNNWMLQKSDYVVSYITLTWGGAAQYVHKAEKSGKTVIHLPNANNCKEGSSPAPTKFTAKP